DASWAAFGTLLEGTAADAGRRVVAVPLALTSPDGRGDGEHVPQRLSVRTHRGPSCDLVLDRDEHAASTAPCNGPGRPCGETRGTCGGAPRSPVPLGMGCMSLMG